MIIGVTAVGADPGLGLSYTVQSKTYTIDGSTLGGPNTWAMGTFFIKHTYLDYDAYLAISRPVNLPIPFKAFLRASETKEYQMSLVAIPSVLFRHPTDSVINTLYWSWAIILDESYRRILNATDDANLMKAEGLSLDIIGKIYNLPRTVYEDDTSYRLRLLTRTKAILSSGVKQTCESIIDQIISMSRYKDDRQLEVVPCCTIVTKYPGVVHVRFTDDESMRIALNLRGLLTRVLDDMIAEGVTWELYTPIVDLPVDIILHGMSELPYLMGAYMRKWVRRTYLMDAMFIKRLSRNYNMNLLTMMLSRSKTFDADLIALGYGDINFLMKLITAARRGRPIPVDVLLKRRNILKSTYCNVLISKSRSSLINMDILNKKGRLSRYAMDIYSVGLAWNAEYAMSLSVVGA